LPTFIHKNLTGADAVHPAAFVQNTDPGSVGANLWWVDTSVGPPFLLKLRNATNTAWNAFGATGPTGATGQTGLAGPAGPPGSNIVSGAAPYICIQDQKTQNTAGGTFTSGAWQTRTLNTIISDTVGIASLAANQVTLQPGTYRCFITCPAVNVQAHQARLQNITDGATLLVGTTEWTFATANGAVTRSVIIGRFGLPSAKVLAVQHQAGATFAAQGFGLAANFTTEVYTIAEFWLEGPAPPPPGAREFPLPSRKAAVLFSHSSQRANTTLPV